MTVVKAQQIILKNYADFQNPVNLNFKDPNSQFKIIDKEINTDENPLKPNQVLLESLYFSNDPAQKGWFTPYESYIPPVPLGSIAPCRGLAKVLESTSDKFEKGDIYSGSLGWATHLVRDVTDFDNKVDATKVSRLSQYISVFGTTTLTAYFVAMKHSLIKRNDEGKTWLITGAAGAVGSALIQIVSSLFKPKRIIGIAGGESKCKFVESLGDKVTCIDYKDDSFQKNFKTILGNDKIDIFVDQVGGEILNYAINFMQVHGRIVQVGAIAGYNGEGAPFTSYATVITKRLSIQGVVLVDDVAEIPKAVGELMKLFSDGSLNIENFKETVVEAKSLEEVPELWTGLFKGKNTGKYITKLNLTN